MNFTSIVKYIVACLIFSLTFTCCITYKPVRITEIKSVEPADNNISTGRVVVNLRVVNPNNYAIKVKKYNLHAYLNDADLGEVKVAEKVVLKRNSDENYNLTFAPDAAKILDALPSILFKGRGEVALRGSVKIKAFILSKKFSVDLKKKVSAADFR